MFQQVTRSGTFVAEGTLVTRRPPHRSVRAGVSAGAIIPKVPVENSPDPQAGGVNPDSGIQRRVSICLGGKTWKRSTNSNGPDSAFCAISNLTGYDRKTVRKYLLNPTAKPEYPPRSKPAGKLEPFKGYLGERLQAGVWNARVLLRELRSRNYTEVDQTPGPPGRDPHRRVWVFEPEAAAVEHILQADGRTISPSLHDHHYQSLMRCTA